MKEVPSKENIENTIKLLKLVPLPLGGRGVGWGVDGPQRKFVRTLIHRIGGYA